MCREILLFLNTETAMLVGSSSEEVEMSCALGHGINEIEAGD